MTAPTRGTASEAMARLGEISRTYETAANSAPAVYEAAARAEAAHRKARARAVLAARATAERMSIAEAEARADADNDVAALFEARLVAHAAAEGLRERLRQLRAQVEVGRTAVVDERAVDAGHARGYGGGA